MPSGSWRIQFQIDGKRYSVTDESKTVCKEKADKRYREILYGIEQEKKTHLTVGKAIDQYIDATKLLVAAGGMLGIKVLDHFILTPYDYVSLREERGDLFS